MEKLLKTIVEYRSAKERIAKLKEAKMGSNLRESQIYVSMKYGRDLSDLFTVYNRQGCVLGERERVYNVRHVTV